MQALQVMTAATSLAPRISKYIGISVNCSPPRPLSRSRKLHRRALSLNPNDSGTLRLLGLILEQQGNFRDARACYEAALAADPNSTQAQRSLEELRSKLTV